MDISLGVSQKNTPRSSSDITDQYLLTEPDTSLDPVSPFPIPPTI
jgi:hypothetical protein